MYGLVPEKIIRLVYEPFYLAIYSLIRDFLRDHQGWLRVGAHAALIEERPKDGL
jgi:hypothetical protein